MFVEQVEYWNCMLNTLIQQLFHQRLCMIIYYKAPQKVQKWTDIL